MPLPMPDDEGVDGDSDGLRLHDNRNVLNIRCRRIKVKDGACYIYLTATMIQVPMKHASSKNSKVKILNSRRKTQDSRLTPLSRSSEERELKTAARCRPSLSL